MATGFASQEMDMDVVLTDAELAELDNLSSDIDNWDIDGDFISSERDYIYGLFR